MVYPAPPGWWEFRSECKFTRSGVTYLTLVEAGSGTRGFLSGRGDRNRFGNDQFQDAYSLS